MDLTISILIYDNEKYVEYVSNLLDSIYKNLKNYKTLLLIDDRRDQTYSLDKIFNLDRFNYEIVSHGINKGILQGYLSSVRNSKTKWLWILDMDDIVTEFNFDNIHDVNSINADLIYFKDAYNNIGSKNMNICDFNKSNSYDTFMQYLGYQRYNHITNLYKEFKTDKVILNINNNIERNYLYRWYECLLPAIWTRILNVEFCKKNILCDNFIQYGKMSMSADALFGLKIYDNLKSILIYNDCLPYGHFFQNYKRYFADVYENDNDLYPVPNLNIDPDVYASWKNINDNLNDLKHKQLKELWKDNIKTYYRKCKINFKNIFKEE